MPASLFRTKKLNDILASAEKPEFALKRTLGAFNVTLLGIGAIIGAGIFATIGTAAAGDAMRPGAGPSLMISFAITAVVCAFTALCYAEFASMVPVAGSAYTYAYATLGELPAWIIGWDLVLEYAVGAATVARRRTCSKPQARSSAVPISVPRSCFCWKKKSRMLNETSRPVTNPTDTTIP